MKITMVARGDDHVVNTPRQILMYQALDYPVPVFAHLPMILGADKQRLSKRHGAVSVLQYRDEGYLPGALINYLARLGWSHGDQEIFTIKELIEKFDWEHVGATAGVFNPQKLEWLNQQWIKMTPPEEIAKLTGAPPEFVKLMQERAKSLNEIREAWRAYMLPELPVYDHKAVAKQLTQETKPLLQQARALIAENFSQGAQAMEHAFRAFAEQRGLGLGKLAQPVRVAVTGTTVSPPLFETMALLGKERTLRRIDAALEKIG
jgi:glutamyl-tRNA synthetase